MGCFSFNHSCSKTFSKIFSEKNVLIPHKEIKLTPPPSPLPPPPPPHQKKIGMPLFRR